jgi:cytochrome c-type biogenesis protein CcmF
MIPAFKIGDYGHIFVIISFIASAIAAFSFMKASSFNNELNKEFISWRRFARGAFYIHVASVIGIVVSLFIIIYYHHYEYHYAWSHSSNNLPTHYMISCFWEGQEGSFLLWIFWHALLGLILIRVNKTWEAPLMTIFCLVQAFLASMIIGVVIPGLEIKIGSSPFILLKDYMGNIPVYKLNPDFIPKDGTGLNPLLQNYWMVIHPPTLFLGFATTLIPFSYCVAGLWKGKYSEWIRPALPWALFSALVLGTGILMGGYWAYETLNFGGYWNWDPVENAVYVPWLVLIACIHTMIAYKNSGKALFVSIFLTLLTFWLILYSTFLTRSGILGESSVHSFTDLGLYWQLLLYLIFFVLLSFALFILAIMNTPSSKEEEVSVYSRELWIFTGVATLTISALQIISTTSIPVFRALANSMFSADVTWAPPANQELHYSNWQIWFAIVIAILSGLGQFFWWKKMDKKKLWDTLAIPLIISLLLSGIIIVVNGLNKPSYILLLTASIFSICANLTIFKDVVKNNFKLSGGAVAHIGIGMMLIGILYSSGYSKVVSLNTTGLLYSKEFPMEMNRDNILLWRNDPEKMADFDLTYKGPRFEAHKFPGYIPKDHLILTNDKYKAIAKEDISDKNEVYFKKGDTLSILPENTFYEVEFKNKEGKVFTLYPRAQVNPKMGLLASPDIKRFYDKDLYSHVSSIPSPDSEREWSETQEYKAKIGDTLILNDYIAIFKNIKNESSIAGAKMDSNDIAIRANISLLGANQTYNADPLLLISMNGTGQHSPYVNEDLGIMISFLNIDPKTNQFTFGVNTTQKDYIILKAIEKPLINVLWIGTLLVVIGLGLAIARRYSEFVKMRDKGLE